MMTGQAHHNIKGLFMPHLIPDQRERSVVDVLDGAIDLLDEHGCCRPSGGLGSPNIGFSMLGAIRWAAGARTHEGRPRSQAYRNGAVAADRSVGSPSAADPTWQLAKRAEMLCRSHIPDIIGGRRIRSVEAFDAHHETTMAMRRRVLSAAAAHAAAEAVAAAARLVSGHVERTGQRLADVGVSESVVS